jgi:signal transduction histidine kinase
MQIRSRLTLQFAGILAIILVLFSLVIYYFNSLYRQQDFYGRIEGRSNIAAAHYLEADEVDKQTRDQNQIKYYQVLPHEVITIYDTTGQLVLTEGGESLELAQEQLQTIISKGKIQFEKNDRQVVGILYQDNQGDFIVLASSVDTYSLRKLQYLKTILIVGFLGSMVVVLLAGWAFAKQALLPITKVVSEVEKISASDLHLRLSNADGHDEVSHLARTFNHMLNRLETAFEMQRTFVSNASHELRTPLTAMIGELDVALMKEREPEEYQRVLRSILEDARLLTELSNGLLQIAQASVDPSKVKLVNLRFDEVVWMAREQALRRQPTATIDIRFSDFPEDEERLIVKGNEALLLIAIVNVLENAIKFSPMGNQIAGTIHVKEKYIILYIEDKGLGIAEDDLNKVFIPFFRAGNVRNITGHGIGLPLTERILKLHKGSIEVNSVINEGTRVTIKLPQAIAFVPS